MPLNPDLLNHISASQAITDSYQVVDRLQNLPPARQATALAMAFMCVAEVFELNMRDEMARCARVMRDAADEHPVQVTAFRNYLINEVRDR